MADSYEKRQVICADSLVWLDSFLDGGFGHDSSVFTSIPDISELPEMFHGYAVEEYKTWFTATMGKIMSKLCIGCYLIIMQSDTRMMNHERDVFEWIDKSHLTSSAADEHNLTLVWHKVVLCNKTMEKRSTGRPSYSHLVCYVKNGCQGLCEGLAISNPLGRLPCLCPMITHRTSHFAVPDVFYRGEMLWVRGIGLDCCYVATLFLRDVAKAKRVIDPFAGVGTVLAMANALGLSALGVELSVKRARRAMSMQITHEQLDSVAPQFRRLVLDKVEQRERWKKQKEEERDNLDIGEDISEEGR